MKNREVLGTFEDYWEMCNHLVCDCEYFPGLTPELVEYIDYVLLTEKLEDSGLKSEKISDKEIRYYWEKENEQTRNS